MTNQKLSKQELLAKLLKERGKKNNVGIERSQQGGPAPLSWAQEQIWFISKLDQQASRAYHLPVIFRLNGALDEVALERACATLLSRHEILRTNIRTDAHGGPYQHIHETPACRLQSHVLPEPLDAAQKQSLYDALVQTALSQPFDLAEDSLIRIRLIKRAEHEHALLLVLHHIIADAWSMGVLTKELSLLYGAYTEGRGDPLTPLRLQYADYAVWQRNLMQGDLLARESAYWRERLAQVPVLALPTDRPRPPVQSFRGARVPLNIDAGLAQDLKALGQQNACTYFITLLAVFNVLLHRYSTQTDIAVGTPVANRVHAEVEPLIGLFVNTLVLRTILDPRQSFTALLKETKAMTFSAFEHQIMPFERVVNAVNPARSQAHSPLFQVMMVLHNVKGSDLEMQGLGIQYENMECSTSQYDLSLAMQEWPDGTLNGGIEYATDLFDESTVSRMAAHFVQLIRAVCAEPAKPIGEVQFLTARETNQVLVEWCDTARDFPNDTCIQELFEQCVEKSPNAVAAIFEGESITYAELNARANQLAHYLRCECNIGPDTLVGVYVERSLPMLVAILGILKAGGAYVPLDPDYPATRLEYMLEDAHCAAVITQLGLRSEVALGGMRVLYLDDPATAGALAAQPVRNMSPAALGLNARHLAYVIYTSGSTGKPKGVMIEHRNLVNFLCSMIDVPGIDKSDILCAVTPISFDIHTLELFAPLITGATVALAKRETSTDPEALATWVASTHTTVLQATPATYKLLVESGWRPASRIKLLCGGEALPAALNDALAGLPNVELWNMYGPTETAVWSLVEPRSCRPAHASIGKPIRNTQVFILDAFGNCVPVGVPGELHIGGAGLARGYLNRPDLTAEKFIPNPFHAASDAASSDRLYRTGDLCRRLADGTVEFLGRLDHQVKIRGFRIELGEIENALTRHDCVSDAVVIAKENSSGDMELAAFVVGHTRLEPAGLRSHLLKTLPNYMIPSAFVQLDALPLTPNSKADRKALQSIQVDLAPSVGYMAPRTALEHQLVDIWAAVLSRDPLTVGIHDSFFELGGHSLLATRLVVQIRDRLRRDVSLRSLFEFPTIAALSEAFADDAGTGSLPAIVKRGSRTGVPASFAQERLWYLDQLEGSQGAYIVSAVFRLYGRLDRSALEKAFADLLHRHEALRTNIRADERGQPYQLIHAQGRGALRHHVLPVPATAQAAENAYQSLLAELIGAPFNLQDDELVRAALIEHQADEYTFVLAMHHIITDGWSMGIVMREVSELYKAHTRGQPSPLDPLPVQYADVSEWQRGYLRGTVGEAQTRYWRNHLRDIPVLEMPTDRPRPAVQSYRGRWLSLEIPGSTAAALKRIGQAQGCTAFMTYLALYTVLLHRYTRQTTLCVGTPIASRLRSEIEPLIGFFVNTLALRTDLHGHVSFNELLAQVREVTLSAYDHQSIPFERVVEVVQPERSQAYAPLFQTMFVLQNVDEGSLDLPGLAVSRQASTCTTSKFDLTLSLAELPDGRVSGGFEYATDLFDESTMARIAAHIVQLAGALAAAPEAPVGRVEMLTADERRQLVECEHGPQRQPITQCIHEMFEAQVDSAPNAVAVVFEQRLLTYAELNERSNQLARYLIDKRGVKPDSLVGVCIERSPEQIIGILAVLKAGGAYVPLDPGYPPARLAYMMTDAAFDTVLSQSGLLDAGAVDSTRIVCVDDAATQQIIDRYATSNVHRDEAGLTLAHLAYVIYTSGSTGQPKGVLVQHAGLSNLANAQSELLGVRADSSVLQFASLSFDAATSEIFMALVAGARLVLISKEVQTSPDLLTSVVEREMVTHATLPPVLLPLLEVDRWAGVATLVVAGERCPQSLAGMWAANRKLVNGYGPTETTVCATMGVIAGERPCIHIGTPIAHTTVYILDEYANRAPVGVPGELHIGGIGVARGYLNQPGLTAEKFVRNPFADGGHAAGAGRLYRTGDLCRRLADGNIEFLGRIDHQVKIRGFRIELGEIEAALMQLDAVENAVVLAKASESGSAYLAAFIVCHDTLSSAAIVQELGHHLPDYMIPSRFTVLSDMPVTPNGKVDRALLLSSIAEAVDDTHTHVLPATDTERMLARVWADVLNLSPDEISTDRDFFSSGGHSLSAMKVVAQVRGELKKRLRVGSMLDEGSLDLLTIRSFLNHSTIRELAIFIETMISDASSATEAVAESGEIDADFLAKLRHTYGIVGFRVATIHNGRKQQYLVGIENLDKQAATSSTTGVPIFCFSKVIVTMTVLALCGKGLLDLDQMLADLLALPADVPGQYRSISIRHLLSHTSGIDDSNMTYVQRHTDSLSDFTGALAGSHILFPPGSSFLYSSTGLVLAACIIESVTGRPWLDAANRHLLNPLGIHIAGDYGTGRGQGLAYTRDNGPSGYRTVDFEGEPAYFKPAQASNVYLSIDDLLKIATVVLNDGRTEQGLELIPAELAALMYRPAVHIENHFLMDGWSLGWMMLSNNIGGFLTGTHGQNTYVVFDYSRQKAMAIQSNTEHSTEFLRELVVKYFGEDIFETRFTCNTLTTDQCVGLYACAGIEIEFDQVGGELHARGRHILRDGSRSAEVSDVLTPFNRCSFIGKKGDYPLQGIISFLQFDEFGYPSAVRVKQTLFNKVGRDGG